MVFNVLTKVLEWLASLAYTIFNFTIGAFKPPDGIAIRYIFRFCIPSSIILCIFMFGGVVVPLIGIFYMYLIIYRYIKCANKGISFDDCFNT
jgi:hypothetical protein